MKNKKKIWVGLASVFMIGSLAFCFKQAGLLENQQQSLSAALYKERALTDEIIIVAIDPKSLSTPSQGGLNGFSSWPSAYYGQVLDTIEAQSPSAVLFDILFAVESNGIKRAELATIAENSTDSFGFAETVLSYIQTPHPYDLAFAEALGRYDNEYLIKSAAGENTFDPQTDSFVYESSFKPLELYEKKTSLAYYNVSVSEESQNMGSIFAIPLRFSVDGVIEEHADLKLVREHLGTDFPLEIPTEEGQMLINYAAPSYSYPMVSFADVYYGQVDPSVFENKIVLIGATAAILQDLQYTPIDQDSPMPGIEIHANAIQTILDEAYLVKEGTVGFLMTIAVLSMGMVFLTLFAPILVGSGVLIASIVAFPFYAQWRFNHGTVIDLIWPLFALLASYLTALAYRNFTEFAEKRQLKTAFSRYVSPELAEQITEKPELLELGGQRRNITALFLDIENFTNLSEGLQPQEVVKVINVYFDALSQVIMSFGGSVDKYEGDAIMALFGAPVPSTDHAVRACRAALAIQARMKDLNAQMGYDLNIRVGLATGDAIVGNMGSSQRFDYTAMGDTVNTASRLEGANKFYKTGILVNPGTYEAANGSIVFRNVDRVCLKGKDNAIEIYQVMGSEEQITPDGKAALADWHNALTDYRAANWDEAEKKIRGVLTALPEDGPAKTLLVRLAELKLMPRKEWDGVWRFESK